MKGFGFGFMNIAAIKFKVCSYTCCFRGVIEKRIVPNPYESLLDYFCSKSQLL